MSEFMNEDTSTDNENDCKTKHKGWGGGCQRHLDEEWPKFYNCLWLKLVTQSQEGSLTGKTKTEQVTFIIT